MRSEAPNGRAGLGTTCEACVLQGTSCIHHKHYESWHLFGVFILCACIVDPQHRQGIRLTLPCCQKTVPADAHASKTLAQYPFLQPLSFICDTQAQDALGSTVSLGR